MPNQDLITLLQQGVTVWNKWREANPWRQHPDLRNANLAKVNLRGAYLSGASLHNADLSGADLTEADLSYAFLNKANLSKANLCNANLHDARLLSTDLRDAILHEAKLDGAWLTDAILINADLSRASLILASLKGAIMHQTNLTNVNLGLADLHMADVNGANFTGVEMGFTVLGVLDLSRVKGLDTILHIGPSSIGIDTIYRSHGNIPESFLRGVGVPENFITYMPSLIGRGIEYHSCFISYASKDERFVQRLYANLQQNGVRCWFAPQDLRIGDRLRVGIDESIRLHDKLLVVLSKFSITSDWVEKEIETAMERERRERRVILFPIRLDNSIMKIESGWPADIRRSRNIGDFRKWKNDDEYYKALGRLLRDLKTEEELLEGKVSGGVPTSKWDWLWETRRDHQEDTDF